MLDMPENMKALIVDDDPVNRKLLRAILRKEGYEPFLAEDGKQAIDIFKVSQPDIVLMDIMMPVMNGYDAARQIKQLSGDRFVPIIFLTAVTDEDALSKCVESGGDDFLTKPYNRVILKAKISAMERIRNLYTTLNAQKTELERYRFNIQHELEFAEHIFQNITSKGSINVPYLNFWTSSMSMSMFNGDLLLTARKPAGGLHILLCDFTGHGLPAAVGALPVSDVFTAMTDRGFFIADIVSEMNRKLKMELPTGFFCAAGFADVDVAQGTLSIWNGGLPEIYVYDSRRGTNRRFASNNLPLGVLDKVMDRGDVSVMEITPDLHLFMYTDGLIETVNEKEEMFGAERLEQCFREGENSQYFLSRVKEELAQFRGNAQQHDDVSFVQLDCSAALEDVPEEVQPTAPQGVVPAEWEMNFDLSAGLLKDINPVPMMLNMLTHIRVPNEHRKRIFTVLTELYTNAMDHGLLRLESELKNTPEGFKVFYEEREKRLATLTQGAAKITIEQVCEDGDYILKIRMSDTGSGFSIYDVIVAENEETRKNLPSGRGIKLVRSLCRTLEYSNGGSTAEATYYMGEKS